MSKHEDGSATDETDFKEISETNFKKIENKAAKIGYADGITEGRESVFQSGFDFGYEDGLLTGFELEKYKAFYKTLGEKRKSVEANLLEEKTIYESALTAEERHKMHFQFLSDNNEKANIDEISKKLQEFTTDYLDMCNDTLPITTNLLINTTK